MKIEYLHTAIEETICKTYNITFTKRNLKKGILSVTIPGKLDYSNATFNVYNKKLETVLQPCCDSDIIDNILTMSFNFSDYSISGTWTIWLLVAGTKVK